MNSRSATWTPATASGSGLDRRRAWEPAVRRPPSLLLLFSVLAGGHAVLALILLQSELFSTVHAIGVLLFGLAVAARPATSHRAIYFASYLATADVLWRMTRAQVFWEYGKYSVVLLFGVIAFARGTRRGLTAWAILYFALFLPSSVLTLDYFGLTHDLRRALSFNLSGPFALAVSVAFFSGLRRPNQLDLTRLVIWMLMPIVGVFSIAAYSTLTATRLDFGNEANFVTSGGFGPNQVSAILGLGVLLSLVLTLNARDPRLRLIALGLAGALQLQSFLTFSRGGTFNVVVAISFLGVHYLRHRRARKAFLTLMIFLGLVVTFLVLPSLNAWTAGSLGERFTSFDTTGRKELAESDLRLFEAHPGLGVGPGLAGYRRADVGRYGIAPHTEFTRALSEHGALGLLSLGALLLIAWQAYRLAPTTLSKGWVAGLVAWSFAEMAHSAMRVVAISFVFGLACLPFYRWGRSEDG